MKKIVTLIALCAASALHGQSTNLIVLHTVVGDERAPILTWQTESNAVYRIDYADNVLNTNTQWQLLYDNYPSHGTNTFWMDSGNDTTEPEIPHPKRVGRRFYRIVKTGTNTAAAPFVQVTSPASNDVLSGEVTVSIVSTTSLADVSIKLYVDGQEMPPTFDGTNFVINTSEWANGPHVLFATGEAISELPAAPRNAPRPNYGRAVSQYVPVTFDNYVSQLYFTEPFFEPELGQTQRVTAVFAAYSDWTLQILDQASNVVRTVTNTGYTMQFDWDGTGQGGTNLPNGVYEYLVTASQSAATAPSGGGGGGGGSAPGPGGAGLQAMSGKASWLPASPMQAALTGWDSYFVWPAPMPPVKVGEKWYPWAEVYGPVTPIEVPLNPKLQAALLTQFSAASSSANALAAAGAGAAKGPKKPPTKPVKGKVGTFGVVYQQYLPNGYTVGVPTSGLPSPLQRVSIEGSTANLTFNALPMAKATAEKFAKTMKANGWKSGFIKADPRAQEIRKTSIGGSNIFGKVNVGLLMAHSVYGTSLDHTTQAQQTYQTYMPFLNNGVNDWLRLSECSFGSTNLRWLGTYACSALRDQNYQSMYSAQVLPINPNLHLLCSTRSFFYGNDSLGSFWALYMHIGATPGAGAATIKRAWFLSVRDVYKLVKVLPSTPVVTLRVAGWPNCFNDKLTLYSAPGTSDPSEIVYEDQQVWPVVNIP